jgi:hypothetical protein
LGKVRVFPGLKGKIGGTRHSVYPKNKQEGKLNKQKHLYPLFFPTHRKERDGWGTQFYPLWIGKAGGRLAQRSFFRQLCRPLQRRRPATSATWRMWEGRVRQQPPTI